MQKGTFESAMSILHEKEYEIQIKIFLLNYLYVFKKLQNLVHPQLNICLALNLDFDPEIGDFLNFKVKNTKDNYFYDQYKISSPNNRTKNKHLIRELYTLTNQLNHSFSIDFINKELQNRNTYYFDFSSIGLNKLYEFILSSKMNSILYYSLLENNLNKNQQPNINSKI